MWIIFMSQISLFGYYLSYCHLSTWKYKERKNNKKQSSKKKEVDQIRTSRVVEDQDEAIKKLKDRVGELEKDKEKKGWNL